MGEFLLYIQTYHNSIARKIRNIRDGVAFPKRRREIDVRIDNEIQTAVQDFNHRFYNQIDGPIRHADVVKFTHRIADLIGEHDQIVVAQD